MPSTEAERNCMDEEKEVVSGGKKKTGSLRGELEKKIQVTEMEFFAIL